MSEKMFFIDTSTQSFQADVIDASSSVPVIVDFWAEWCGPCKVLKPLLEKLANEYAGRFILAKVDADAYPELSEHFGIRSIPTVVAFVDGQPVDGFTGALPEGQLRQWLDKFVSADSTPNTAETSEAEIDYFAAATAAREAGDHAEAVHLLNEGLRHDPKNPEGLLLLADICVQKGKLSEAADIAEELGILIPDDPRFAVLESRIQIEHHKLNAAAGIAALENKVSNEPDNHVQRLELINELKGVENYRGALEHLLLMVKKDRSWNDEAARKGMLEIFNAISSDEQHMPLVREFRTQLARTLN